MTDIVERLRTVDISWSQEGEWCAEAADEIIKLREDKKFGFELMDTFVKEINRLKQLLTELEAESSRTFNRGHADGEDIGYKDGFKDGYNDGLEAGRAGCNDGYR